MTKRYDDLVNPFQPFPPTAQYAVGTKVSFEDKYGDRRKGIIISDNVMWNDYTQAYTIEDKEGNKYFIPERDIKRVLK
jgi:hypothetical protein